MTDYCQHVPLSRLFETQNSRGFIDITLHGNEVAPFRSRPHSIRDRVAPFGRDPIPVCAGLLRFSLFEAVKKQSFIKLEP